jgi:hypothetical protein
LTDDLDFNQRDRSLRAEVEVTIGDLSDELVQIFFDHLEYWDTDRAEIISDAPNSELLDQGKIETVVRLCYRAEWSKVEDQADHWVDFSKTSDPDSGYFDRVPRRDLAAIPFFLGQPGRRPLGLGARAIFRHLAQLSEGDDLARAVDRLSAGMERLAEEFGDATQVKSALRTVLASVQLLLGLPAEETEKILRFVAEGGVLGALLRSLSPTLDLPGLAGFLPLSRHGSTASAQLSVAELLAVPDPSSVVAFDDFGENLDSASARHLTALLRARFGQVWLSTRRASVAEAFHLGELIRLALDEGGNRRVYYGREPSDRASRLAARHFLLQVLPAITARTVFLLEGPHDRASLTVLSDRLLRDESRPLPAAHGIAIADADVLGSGGSSALPRLAEAVRHLGFFVIALVDGDQGPQAQPELNALLAVADTVIRLPDTYSIERVILDGLTDDDIRTALRTLEIDLPPNLDELASGPLSTLAIHSLKQKAGLHGQFLDALPLGHNPSLGARVLEIAIDAAARRQRGLIQL